MERHGFAMKIKKGQMNAYRKKLGEIWPELTGFLDRNEISNFSIWNAEDLIFGYYENQDNRCKGEGEKAEIAVLTEKIQDTFDWISTPGQDMRLMYHNFGIVRKNKELIRHRVFMTRLKDGCEEEYKARHDRLVAEGERLQIPVRTVISVFGAPEDIFSAMMKLTLPWKQRKRLLQEKQRFPGKCVSLRLWTGSQMMWTG